MSNRELILYPVVLDETTTAFIRLPRDLTVAEAERIYRMMLTLCVDGPNA